MRRAFDPLILHLGESLLRRRTESQTLSFGESLDGSRDILLAAARELPDLLAIVPAAKALRKRFRLARIHVLSNGCCSEVLRARPEIFNVVPWKPEAEPILSRSFLRRVLDLRSHSFDLAIVNDNGEARLERMLGVLSGAPLRAGIHPEGSDPTLNLVVAAGRPEGYRPVQSLGFLSFLGIDSAALEPGWDIPEADLRYAKRFLELRRRDECSWLVGIDPGPGHSGVRPSVEKLAWLLERLASSRNAEPIILTEDMEAPYVKELASLLKKPPVQAASRGIRDLLSFAACCDLFLSANTSLFHFAVAMRIPTIGLFAEEEEERWVPSNNPESCVVRWRPGQRIHEKEFLGLVDAVQRTKSGEFPLRLTLAEESVAPSVSRPAPKSSRRVSAR